MADRFIDDNLDYIKIKEKPSKTLTDEHKRLHWEAYAQKTARQETMFKRVFDSVFDEQKQQVVESLEKTGKLPELDDEGTAQKFQPAIELVYESSFSEAV